MTTLTEAYTFYIYIHALLHVTAHPEKSFAAIPHRVFSQVVSCLISALPFCLGSIPFSSWCFYRRPSEILRFCSSRLAMDCNTAIPWCLIHVIVGYIAYKLIDRLLQCPFLKGAEKKYIMVTGCDTG